MPSASFSYLEVITNPEPPTSPWKTITLSFLNSTLRSMSPAFRAYAPVGSFLSFSSAAATRANANRARTDSVRMWDSGCGGRLGDDKARRPHIGQGYIVHPPCQ